MNQPTTEERTDPIRDLLSRVDTEFSNVWATEHPALFVEGVQRFQRDYPTLAWRHHVDLSRAGFIKLIAVRRERPFKDMQEYLAAGRLDGELYLSEVGYGR